MANRKPILDITYFKKRREKIAPYLKDSALVLCSNPEFLRNYDTTYEYRQDTNFFYLTGFEEPESVFVYRPGCNPETVLFVRPKDVLRETWDGFRYGPELCQEYFLIDKVFLVENLESELPKLLKEVNQIYYKLNQFPDWDQKILKSLEDTALLNKRSGKGILTIHDSSEFLGEFRIIKDQTELGWLKQACKITAQAHLETMKFVKPGMNEKQVEGFLQFQFKMQLSPRVAYNPIVASGSNACTLHYNFNDQNLKSGDLLLIDAGAEFNYMNGDITRTFPINGKFTSAQNDIYTAVLNAQKKILEIVKPGIHFSQLQSETTKLLTQSLLDLKILKGSLEENITKNNFSKFYPHGVSHWLGMDTHDAGAYQVQGQSRVLEPNMCFTIEPGLYIPENADVPNEFKGIGIRIEDNVVVTNTGYENMTAFAVKEIKEIESLMS